MEDILALLFSLKFLKIIILDSTKYTYFCWVVVILSVFRLLIAHDLEKKEALFRKDVF